VKLVNEQTYSAEIGQRGDRRRVQFQYLITDSYWQWPREVAASNDQKASIFPLLSLFLNLFNLGDSQNNHEQHKNIITL